MQGITVKRTAIAAFIFVILYSLLNYIVTAVTGGALRLSLDVMGLWNAIASLQILAFVLTLIGILLVGLIALLTPSIVDEVEKKV